MMQADAVTLYDYWRSSASYRLRIALNMLGVNYTAVPVNLPGGEHRRAEHLARNPQGLVPALEIDGRMMTQSLAIIEYLDETRSNAGFLPDNPADRQTVRALSHAIAMEIHPVCNMRVAACAAEIAQDAAVKKQWMQKFISEGLLAFESMLQQTQAGAYCFGDKPTMADICLVPQVYNALRWQVDLSATPGLLRIYANCSDIPAFGKAHPDNVRP